MASLFSLRIPICTTQGTSIIQGSAAGSVLAPYQIYEVRLHDGTIFNVEAIPFNGGYQWYSMSGNQLASSVGREIERFFGLLRKKRPGRQETRRYAPFSVAVRR